MMDCLTQNIFDLQAPHEYRCQVLHYRNQHSFLLVRAVNDANRDELYFYFLEVEYFEGPMRWQGANFYRTTDDEQIKLLENINVDVELFLETSNLFVVESNGFKVKILATSAGKTDDISGSFPHLVKERPEM